MFYLPQDIIENSIKAFSVNVNGSPRARRRAGIWPRPTARRGIQTYRGDAGCHVARDVFVTGPLFTRFDFSMKKRLQ